MRCVASSNARAGTTASGGWHPGNWLAPARWASRSRIEGSGVRTIRTACGLTLLEALFVTALLVTLAGTAFPLVASQIDESRTFGAARYLAGRLNFARSEAVKRSAFVALRMEPADTGYRFTFYVDGNRNGLRSRDVTRRVDLPIGLADRLSDKFAGVTFGVVDGVVAIDSTQTMPAGSDPIRFGQTEFVSFNPDGSATAGTFYIRGRGRQQAAVRVLGITGRVRVLRFNFGTRRWMTQ